MTKTAKDKKSSAANKDNKFAADDKVFAMDGGDLYEAKVSFSNTPIVLPILHVPLHNRQAFQGRPSYSERDVIQQGG